MKRERKKEKNLDFLAKSMTMRCTKHLSTGKALQKILMTNASALIKNVSAGQARVETSCKVFTSIVGWVGW